MYTESIFRMHRIDWKSLNFLCVVLLAVVSAVPIDEQSGKNYELHCWFSGMVNYSISVFFFFLNLLGYICWLLLVVIMRYDNKQNPLTSEQRLFIQNELLQESQWPSLIFAKHSNSGKLASLEAREQ